MSILKRAVRLLSPGVPAAILPGGRPKEILPRPPIEQVKFTAREFKTRTREDVVTAAEVAPYVAAVYSGGSTMSAFTAIANLAGSYLQYRAASRAGTAAPLQMSGPTLMPSTGGMPMIQQAMGALPQIGRALPMLGAAGGVVVAGARAAARSAIVYCRRHPNWCSTIGGTAAVAALIESGQLPPIRRRRGRGITPKDLRSFRRVANLIRGYCPTVRRIPTRKLHVRGTGITHA